MGSLRAGGPLADGTLVQALQLIFGGRTAVCSFVIAPPRVARHLGPGYLRSSPPELSPLLLLVVTLLTAPDTTQRVRVPVAPAETLDVAVTGAGQPVVFIPGLFGSAYSYRQVTDSLARAGYRSYVIEPLGIGRSSRPQDADYSLTAQADRVAAALDTLKIRRAVLVAHSVGASIAFRLAYRRPELVRGLVSLEGGAAETATSKGFRRVIRFAPAARFLDGRQLMEQLVYRDMKQASRDDSWIDAAVVRGYTQGMVSDVDATLKAFQSMARATEPERLADHLASIQCPVVLLVGDTKHDSGPPREEVDLLLRELPAFAVDTVPRSGFFIQEERPAAVASAVDLVARSTRCSD